jgi:hypothetical protein
MHKHTCTHAYIHIHIHTSGPRSIFCATSTASTLLLLIIVIWSPALNFPLSAAGVPGLILPIATPPDGPLVNSRPTSPCVCIYVCVYVCVCKYVCMYVYIYMYIYIYIYIYSLSPCFSTCIYVHIQKIHMYVYLRLGDSRRLSVIRTYYSHIHIRTHTHTNPHIHIHTYVRTYLGYIYIHAYVHALVWGSFPPVSDPNMALTYTFRQKPIKLHIYIHK